MSDLVEFLIARLDEDERAVRAVLDAGPAWDVVTICQMSVTAHLPTREHVERWSPARVLAEADAKRRLITGFVEVMEGDYAPWNEEYLCLLALPYDQHPDYRPEWAV